MNRLSFLVHGGSQPPPARIPLRAGPLALVYQDGDLRQIRLGQNEVLRRIFGAVRDRNWGTVPGTLVHETILSEANSFRVTCQSRHDQGPIQFTWDATIEGEPDGTVLFRFSGRAESTFPRNRIGLCVLHPIRECAGKPCRIRTADDSLADLAFPEFVANQQPIPGFQNIRSITHDVGDGFLAEVGFLGESFETEDQRNWIDASFKTYGTPLALPFPVEITRGTVITQEVTLRLLKAQAKRPSPPTSPDRPRVGITGPPPPLEIRFKPGSGARLPEIGVASASHGRPLGGTELRRLGSLGLSHLRRDVRLASAAWEEGLRVASADALELGLPLELAVHFPRSGGSDAKGLERFVAILKKARVDIVRLLVLQDGCRSTPDSALALARERFADLATPLGAGTAADLYQLHLEPPAAGADFIAWSMNPQVHATDPRSIAETPEAAAHQVRAVGRTHPGLPLVVSPITLKPRFNPVATDEVSERAPGLPPEVDPRQLSLFGAGWTLGMLGALASTPVESLTFFETSGWRGIVETESGSPAPDLFPSRPGDVFPMYHVFADLAPFARARVLTIQGSAPPTLAALGLSANGRTAVWCANLTDRPQSVRLEGLAPGIRVRLLDESTVVEATQEPERYRTRLGTTASVAGSALILELPPFGLAHGTSERT